MDPAVSDLAVGDVHVRDGTIVAVAQKIETPSAQVIDGSGMICPGLGSSRVGEMTTLLKRWMRETDDHLDLDKPDWGYQLKQAAARPIEDQSVAE